MPDYRRYRIPGGTYFFTVTLLDHQNRLAEPLRVPPYGALNLA